MNASPESGVLDTFLSRVATRVATVRAVEGMAAGVLAGLVVMLVFGAGLATGVVVIGAAAVASGILRAGFDERFRRAWWRDRPAMADRVERLAPACRNLVLTAAELRGTPTGSSEIGQAIERRAASAARAIDPGSLFPLRRPLAWLGTAIALATIVLVAGTANPDQGLARTRGVATSAGIDRVDVIVTPPSHTGQAADTLGDPDRLDVLAGTTIRLVVRSGAPSVRLERVAGRMDLERAGATHSVGLLATDDDFLAITAVDSAGTGTGSRLIGLTVIPDRDPVVRITAPGRDLFFSAVPDTLVLAVDADDDLALASLALRYTWVSGSGERFTFVERELPLAVMRGDARHWTARVTWRLDTLALAAGDMIVYRAEATDRRPGAVPARSDSYVLEVVGPGAAAAEGFATDDERDRYAVSQQMVILKTERLIAVRRGLDERSLADSARLIAAEQRRVRAEFVFMMGGELEDDESLSGTLMVDEEEEAEAESDLLAGRMQNRGRIEMQRAIRAMSRAASQLTTADLDRALVDERAALDNLMRAFSRSRILLRALSQRERLDLDRRLSGALVDATSQTRRVPEAPAQARLRALRSVLARIAGSRNQTPDSAARALSSAALDLVRIDPADDSLRAIAVLLERITNSSSGQDHRGEEIEDLTLRLAARLRELLPAAPAARRTELGDRLRGALADELSARGKGVR